MKRSLSILLFIAILFLTGCGVKVTRVENTSAAPTETLSVENYTTAAETEEAVTQPSTEALTTVTEPAVESTAAQETAGTSVTEVTTVAGVTTVTQTAATSPSTTKRQWTTRVYSQPETKPATTTQPQSTTKKETPTTTKRASSYYTPPASQPSVTKFTTQSDTVNCTIEIECRKLLENIEDLKEEKKSFVPSGGYILKKTTLSLPRDSTVFDALKYACENNVCSDECEFCKASGIQFEHMFTPGYGSEYIRGIHQLYEKDCGSRSGWMYSVNGVFPNYGCSEYRLKDGDTIKWSYTCDLGEDL